MKDPRCSTRRGCAESAFLIYTAVHQSKASKSRSSGRLLQRFRIFGMGFVMGVRVRKFKVHKPITSHKPSASRDRGTRHPEQSRRSPAPGRPLPPEATTTPRPKQSDRDFVELSTTAAERKPRETTKRREPPPGRPSQRRGPPTELPICFPQIAPGALPSR